MIKKLNGNKDSDSDDAGQRDLDDGNIDNEEAAEDADSWELESDLESDLEE